MTLLFNQGLWSRRATWPEAGPEYIFAGAALDRVGKALHGSEWTGRETEDNLPRVLREPRASDSRLTVAISWLAGAARSGRVGCREIQPGHVYDVEPTRWFGVDDRGVFSRCSLARATSGNLFFLRVDLEREIAGLAHAATVASAVDLSAFSDQLQFAVALAKKWKATRDWSYPKRATLEANIIEAWREFRPGKPDLSPAAAANVGFVLKGFVENR